MSDVVSKKVSIRSLNLQENKKVLNLKLEDDEGAIFNAKIRTNIDLFIHTYNIGSQIIINGKTIVTEEEKYIEIAYVRPVREVTIQRGILQQYIEKFNSYKNSIKDQDFSTILSEFFDIEEIANLFFKAPAAKDHHHNYEHGLLEHTIEVIDLLIPMADYYSNEINKELLITGAILHDIGKIRCYDFNGRNIIENVNKKYLGHIMIATILLSKAMPDSVESSKQMMLFHLIAGHHSKLEWGSPVIPQTKEAFLLSQADLISATMKSFK